MRSPEPEPSLSRRSFLAGTSASALAGHAALTAADELKRSSTVIDCHSHLSHHGRATWKADDRKLIEAADRLGIERMCCSILTPRRPASVEGFRDCNLWVADALKRFPGRVL